MKYEDCQQGGGVGIKVEKKGLSQEKGRWSGMDGLAVWSRMIAKEGEGRKTCECRCTFKEEGWRSAVPLITTSMGD